MRLPGHLVLAVVGAVMLGACSPGVTEPPAVTEDDRFGSAGPASQPAIASRNPSGLGPRRTRGGTGPVRGPGPRASGREPRGDANPGRPGRNPRPRQSRVRDYVGDTDSHGSVPAYGDIVWAAVIDRGRQVELVLTVREEIPDRMPDRETHSTLGFRIYLADGKEAYAYVNGDSNGWEPDMRSGRNRPFDGAFSIAGSTVRFRVPWARLGDPAAMRWSATTSWLRSRSGETDYQFDAVPDNGRMFFRRSRR